MDLKHSHKIAAQLRPVLTRLVRKMRKLSPVNTVLSQTERSVLVLLENQQFLSAELAVIEKITPQSMGAVLKHLDGLNLIERTPSETDKRKVYISISETGKEIIRQVRNERDEWLSKAIAEVCTEKEQEAILAAIGPLSKLVDF
ncbi:MarR family winged helix-turn-helix transcriptional regulator [Pedobacter nototheniae]|uniref:MarR family winged helix-turn-helix transcriptional regulator n=1 Tax=Pedobacter nototheniae TaxID=2488994 RepID=UPI0029304F30|nr:MarR family transcriptional regulator [Pedobacter nototheniae]